MRAFFLLMLLASGAILNAIPRGPHRQPPEENYLARYHVCTEQRWGWPLAFYFRYTGGYVDPNEWLAWDVEPIDSRRDLGAAAADLFLFAVATTFVVLATIRRSPPGSPEQRQGV